jgi:hypothetical protein
VTAEVDNGNLLPYVALAIDFIVSSALQIAADRNVPPLPIVINFSYGRLEGPHDDTHPIEQLIEWTIAACQVFGFPLRVVLPAGNSFLQRTHAQRSFQATGETKTLNWRVLPDDRTDSFAEIWLPQPAASGPASRLTVTLTTPTGQSFSIDETLTVVPFPSGWLAYVTLPTRRVFVVLLLPTTDFNPAATLATAGTSSITPAGSPPPTSCTPGWPATRRCRATRRPAGSRFSTIPPISASITTDAILKPTIQSRAWSSGGARSIRSPLARPPLCWAAICARRW